MTEAPVGPKPASRLKSLDALRGVAALIVLLYHFTRRYGERFDSAWHPLFSYDGQFGVLLFFMISGYVITLTTERVHKPLDFLFFRFSRLYPTFWFCLCVTATVVVLAHFPPADAPPHKLVTPLSFAANATMLAKTIRRFIGMSDRMPYIDGSYWSLEIELFFYAVVFLLLLTRKTHRIVGVAMAFVIFGMIDDLFNSPALAELPAVSQVTAFVHHWPHLAKRVGGMMSAIRWLCFFEFWPYFGIGIAIFARQKRGQRRGPVILAVLCALGLTLHMPQTLGDNATMTDVQIQLVKVFVSALLFVLAVYDKLPLLRWRVFVGLGVISYPLYLVHQYIGYVILHTATGHGVSTNVAIGLAMSSAIVLATVISFGFERPSMHLLRRLYLRTTHHPATPVPISGMAPVIPETATDRVS